MILHMLNIIQKNAYIIFTPKNTIFKGNTTQILYNQIETIAIGHF